MQVVNYNWQQMLMNILQSGVYGSEIACICVLTIG